MRFTILGHAAMLVETNGIRILTDPWLFGSCYWRSWWNYPKPPPLLNRLADIDYIYITHHHWDHFHGPSLRRLPASARILIPKATTTRKMLDDLKGMPFKEVIELPHGRTTILDGGVRLTSYHFAFAMDSTMVLDNGTDVLVNLNDCKITGFPLRQITRSHPKVDFMFRSHSSASAYPYCVEFEDEAPPVYRTNEDYLEEFARTAEIVRPRYAIPFASNNCFLHRETFRYNETVVPPTDVEAYFDTHGPKNSQCVVMVAGDSWDSTKGFQLQSTDFFSNRAERLQAYAKEVEGTLQKQYKKEDKAEIRFEWFESYFERLLRSLPRVVRRLFDATVAFQTFEPGEPGMYFLVDFRAGRVFQSKEFPPHTSLVIKTHPYVLKDCLRRRMFSVFFPSKRLQVLVRTNGSVKHLFMLSSLLELHEMEYLPLRGAFTVRFLQAWVRRWREVLHYTALGSRVALRLHDDPVRVLVPKTY